jgi:hypothetical protein
MVSFIQNADPVPIALHRFLRNNCKVHCHDPSFIASAIIGGDAMLSQCWLPGQVSGPVRAVV